MLKMTHHHEFCGSVECWLRREDRGPVASRSRSYIHLSLVFSQSLLFARSFSMLRCFCSSLIIRRSALITIVSSYVHWSHPACTHLLFFSSLVQPLIQDACCSFAYLDKGTEPEGDLLIGSPRTRTDLWISSQHNLLLL